MRGVRRRDPGAYRRAARPRPGAAGSRWCGLLGRITVSSAGRGGGAGLARLAAGAAAKTASASTGFGANALAGVAVVASATAGVTVGVGKLVHEMAHREGVRSGVYAPAPPARTAPGAPGLLLGAAASPRARTAGVPGGAATGTRTRTTSSHRTVVGDRWSGGDTRPVRIDGSNVGKGSASMSATVGSATTAVGDATTPVGTVTSTAVGSVTSTVAGGLSGKHLTELAPDFRPPRA
jgi:hypothetical protein